MNAANDDIEYFVLHCEEFANGAVRLSRDCEYYPFSLAQACKKSALRNLPFALKHEYGDDRYTCPRHTEYIELPSGMIMVRFSKKPLPPREKGVRLLCVL